MQAKPTIKSQTIEEETTAKFQQNPTLEQSLQQHDVKIGLLIGGPGSGKTSLINSLLGQLSQTPADKDTWKTYECKYNEKPFKIRDSLSIKNFNQCDREEDFDLFRQEFYLNINKKAYNQIFVVCKYERIPKMKELLTQCIMPINKYIPLMTLVITHWELSQDKTQDEQLIRKDLLKFFRMTKLILVDSQKYRDLQLEFYNKLNDNLTEIDLTNTSLDIIPQEDQNFKEQLNQLAKQVTDQQASKRTHRGSFNQECHKKRKLNNEQEEIGILKPEFQSQDKIANQFENDKIQQPLKQVNEEDSFQNMIDKKRSHSESQTMNGISSSSLIARSNVVLPLSGTQNSIPESFYQPMSSSEVIRLQQ